MKKSTQVFFLLFLVIFCPRVGLAQNQCAGSFKEYFLNSNNIRASFFPRGNKFTDGSQGGFLVPYPSKERLTTIFASSPWIGGYDEAGNLKLAVETYPTSGTNDFSVGPLSPIGTIVDSICGKYDQAWTVYYEDIQRHMLDYYEDFKIDDTIPSIFGWPARGNKFFKHYYGFELPDDNLGLAPFFDANGNNRYDPDKGDYPFVRIAGYEYIPDQILWMVFNDVDINNVTGHEPLRFEIQLTAFAFHCQDNSILNNTIFNSYKIINRSVISKDSIFFGVWTDYDLGCSEDDFIGSDSARSTEFVYNADLLDGDVGSYCPTGNPTYSGVPPVQSLTYLYPPMYSMITSRRSNLDPLEYYHLLNGEWEDGQLMRPDSDGYYAPTSLSPTKFLFNGDPRDSTSWSANNVWDKGRDVKVVSSVSLGRMEPGAIKEVEMAYMFHHDPNGDSLDQITKMYHDVDSLVSFIDQTTSFCTTYQLCLDGDCVWPGDFNHDGIADQFDLLYWGVMTDTQGGGRNGLVSWRGHYAPQWNFTLPQGIDFKHGDGNGDGIIDISDLQQSIDHFLLTTSTYQKTSFYPVGSEVKITSMPIDTNGNIKRMYITAGEKLENVLGLAYELEFDTTLFQIGNGLTLEDGPDTTICIYDAKYQVQLDYPSRASRYAFVAQDHIARTIQQGFTFESFLGGLKLKPGIDYTMIPDSTVIRLRNLIAIDPDGNSLHIGSEPLVLYKNQITSMISPLDDAFFVYPNPTHDLLYVDTPADISAEILNLQGQIIQRVHLKNNSPIDVSGFSPGVYLLRIIGSSHTYKVVIY